MKFTRSFALVLGVALLAGACTDEPTGPRGTNPEVAPSMARLDALFEQAGREFNVPAPLLKAVSYAETQFQMVRGAEEFPGMPAAFGVMALRGERLDRGAQLARVSVEAAKGNLTANIRAAAALLNAYASEQGIDRGNLGAWAPAVARYSGIASSEGQAAYVHTQVYAALNQGVVARAPSGEVLASISPTTVRASFAAPTGPVRRYVDYASAVWRPSPNYNSRPSDSTGKIHMVVIHTCESSYSGCWSWLTNSSSGVSAHYVVNESGSEISQLVHEASRAWHIGAYYDCNNNGGADCGLNGVQSNNFTVGIEHGGYASQSSWPSGQIDASAKLSCDISKSNGVPRDRNHYVGHGKLQPYNRTDPGANWPWSTYMSKINSYCNTALIIDSNNNNNDTSKGYISVSGNWTSSANVAGYYGTGYFWASTQAVSDPATFYFYLSAPATKTIDAWWTAASDRSTTAPFIAYNASGTKLGSVSVNQQTNGGKWNTLGTWNFSAGWNKVILSRWTTAGYVVIADAVRVR